MAQKLVFCRLALRPEVVRLYFDKRLETSVLVRIACGCTFSSRVRLLFVSAPILSQRLLVNRDSDLSGCVVATNSFSCVFSILSDCSVSYC